MIVGIKRHLNVVEVIAAGYGSYYCCLARSIQLGSTAVAATAQRALVGNQTGVTCYECGRQGHCGRQETRTAEIRLGTIKLRQELMQLEEEGLTSIPTSSG
ncbi:hypothetical protein Tco_1534970, partial [Tanacetum coccineum]